jgi:hypothetical protein
MSWPFSSFLSLRSNPPESNSWLETYSALDAGSSPRKPGSLLMARLNVYLLVSVISNESANLLIVGGSDGLVNITITA